MRVGYGTDAERWLAERARGFLQKQVPDPRHARRLLYALEGALGRPEAVRLVAGQAVRGPTGYHVEGRVADSDLWRFPDGSAVATHWKDNTLCLDAVDPDGVGWAVVVDSSEAIVAALDWDVTGMIRGVLVIEAWVHTGRPLPALTQEQVVHLLAHPSREVRLAAIAAVGLGGQPFASLQAALDAGILTVVPNERRVRRRIAGCRTEGTLSREEQARVGSEDRRTASP